MWLTNESISHIINSFVQRDEYLYISSGVALLGLTFPMVKYYRIDPIDCELLVNEQSIHLTSQYTDEVRDYVTLPQFIEEIRSSPNSFTLYQIPRTMIKDGSKNVKELEDTLNEEKLKDVEDTFILKRWKSPSIMEVLQLPNSFRMILFVCAIYFKFRVVNKRMQLYGN